MEPNYHPSTIKSLNFAIDLLPGLSATDAQNLKAKGIATTRAL